MLSKCGNRGHLVPCYLNSVKLSLTLSNQYRSLEYDLNLGLSKIAVFED